MASRVNLARKVPAPAGPSGSDNGVIVTSALVVFGLGFLNSYVVKRPQPRIRLFIGVGILYIGLSVAAEFNSKLARNFAILIMLTAILAEGGGVLNWLQGRGTTDKLNVFGGGTGTPNIPGTVVNRGLIPGATAGLTQGGKGVQAGIAGVARNKPPRQTTIRLPQTQTNPFTNVPGASGPKLTQAAT